VKLYSQTREMTAPFTHLIYLALLLLSLARTTNAFAPRSNNIFRDPTRIEESSSLRTQSFKPTFTKNRLGEGARRDSWSFAQQLAGPNGKRNSRTGLFMYNLPPGKNENELGDILKGAASLILVVAFFASPLGGLVFGIFNSFLLLAILTPVLATVGISVWQYFNTITGSCPNCGAPVRVVKTKEGGLAQPTICISCGSILQANYDNSGIDNVTGRNSLNDLSTGPFGGGGTIFDVFGGPPSPGSRTTSTTTIVEEKKTQKDKIRREATIIDVEVDDDAWQ